MTSIAVIGSGMAACGASHRLRSAGLAATLFDQGAVPGGHTRTHRFDGGWLFDDGPHISFTKNPRVQELLAANVRGDYQIVTSNVNNHWKGHWIRHPAVVNLHGLPDDLVVACLRDFIATLDQPSEPAADYAEWLVRAYGRTFAETFPFEYSKKVHTTTPDRLTTDWLGPRLYRPSLEEVLLGAVTSQTPDVHYISEYRYPTHGGFFSYLEPFLRGADLRMNHRLVQVDPRARVLTFESGAEIAYDHLISSVPLPDLVSMIAGVPLEVVDAAATLAATSVVLINIGIDRPDVSDASWTYFYDQDFVITRLSYPSRFAPSMAPPGCGSFQCEIYYSARYRPLTVPIESLIEPAIDDLRRCGLIRDDDRIMFRNAMLTPFANIIHDHEKAPALAVILPYLEEIEVRTCGRYGLWGYQWTDDAFVSGEDAAQAVIDAL